MREFKTRTLLESDLPALRLLFLKSRKDTFHWVDATKFTLHDFDVQTEGEWVFVVHIDNQLIGFISIWMADNFIHHLYVDHSFSNQGVGSHLLHTAVKKMEFPVTLKCLVQNTNAMHFYQKHGFRIKDRGISDDGDYLLLELVLMPSCS